MICQPVRLPDPELQCKLSPRFDLFFNQKHLAATKHLIIAKEKGRPKGPTMLWCGERNCKQPLLEKGKDFWDKPTQIMAKTTPVAPPKLQYRRPSSLQRYGGKGSLGSTSYSEQGITYSQFSTLVQPPKGKDIWDKPTQTVAKTTPVAPPNLKRAGSRFH